jgi:hypothetical protein
MSELDYIRIVESDSPTHDDIPDDSVKDVINTLFRIVCRNLIVFIRQFDDTSPLVTILLISCIIAVLYLICHICYNPRGDLRPLYVELHTPNLKLQ